MLSSDDDDTSSSDSMQSTNKDQNFGENTFAARMKRVWDKMEFISDDDDATNDSFPIPTLESPNDSENHMSDDVSVSYDLNKRNNKIAKIDDESSLNLQDNPIITDCITNQHISIEKSDDYSMENISTIENINRLISLRECSQKELIAFNDTEESIEDYFDEISTIEIIINLIKNNKERFALNDKYIQPIEESMPDGYINFIEMEYDSNDISTIDDIIKLANLPEINNINNTVVNKENINSVEMEYDSNEISIIENIIKLAKLPKNINNKSMEKVETEKPFSGVNDSVTNINTSENDSDLIYVSSDDEEEDDDVSEERINLEIKIRDFIEEDLFRASVLYGKVSVQLPDKGNNLHEYIEKLDKELSDQVAYLELLTLKNTENITDTKPVVPIKNEPFYDFNDTKKLFPPRIKLENDNKDDHMHFPLWQGIPNVGKKSTNITEPSTNPENRLTLSHIKEFHDSIKTCPKEDVLAVDPVGLNISLMNHQRYALSWMMWREKQKPCGGILADDMGLGKTLTMISLVLANKELKDGNIRAGTSYDSDEDGVQRHRKLIPGGTLVVCPASLIKQWESEVYTRVMENRLQIGVYHGTDRTSDASDWAAKDIVVTTYALTSIEANNNGPIYRIKWDRIILDEGHIIRNHKSFQSEACSKLKSKKRWILTGTPIQNKVLDFYALLRFLRLKPFNDLGEFKIYLNNSTERLSTLIKPLMLRRTKDELMASGAMAKLPDKKINRIAFTLDTDEMNVYQIVMVYSRNLFTKFLEQRAEKQGLNYKTEEHNLKIAEAYELMKRLHHANAEIRAHHILTLILRLRQTCCHPSLIISMCEENKDDITENVKLFKKETLSNISSVKSKVRKFEPDANNKFHQNDSHAKAKVFVRSNPVFNPNRISSKFKTALDLLNEKVVKSKEKAVVVSQWTSVLLLFSKHLTDRNIEFQEFNGQVKVSSRNDIVIDFNNFESNTQVLLLSLTAGGVGLNLIGANHLLLLDPHWNPQLEAQAQDRIYRLGQQKEVNIYKFICEDSIEERIELLQKKKLEIAQSVLTGVRQQNSNTLTIDDMKSLFGMR